MKVDKAWLQQVKAGDIVMRLLGGTIPMLLRVGEVTELRIKCGGWEFSRETGAEVDEELGWDGTTITGSYIRKPTEQELKEANP